MRRSFVGRERELAALQGAVDRAVSGRGGLVRLLGEPGVGKTRLADELVELAYRRGLAVGWARTWRGSPPFALRRTSTFKNRIYGYFSSGRADEVLRLATEDVVVEMIPLGQVHHGHAGFRDFMKAFTTAFPDIRIETRRQVADESRVAAEFVAHGTHKGPLMTPTGPIAATGKKVTFTVCEVWDIRDGKLAGLRNYQDAGSILRQIGAL